MRRIIYLFFICACLLIFNSCADKQYQVLFQQKKSLSDTSSQTPAVPAKEYRIKSQDILQIRNLQNFKRYITTDAGTNGTPNIAGENSQGDQTILPDYQVEDDGTVILPDIGHVQVAGLTRAEARKLVEDTYRRELLKNPIIELKIINLKVTLLGEVRGPGNYILTKERTTLVEVLGQAGGVTEKADETTVKIIRGTQLNPHVTVIDLGNVQSVNDPRAILQNGDIIYVSQNRRSARADNLQSISIIAQPALLLFNTALIILTLIRR